MSQCSIFGDVCHVLQLLCAELVCPRFSALLVNILFRLRGWWSRWHRTSLLRQRTSSLGTAGSTTWKTGASSSVTCRTLVLQHGRRVRPPLSPVVHAVKIQHCVAPMQNSHLMSCCVVANLPTSGTSLAKKGSNVACLTSGSPSIPGPSILCSSTAPLFFKMAQNLDLGCVLISDPNTLGAGAKTRLHTPKAVTYHEQPHYCRFMIGHSLGRMESRIKKCTPHCNCRPLGTPLGLAKSDSSKVSRPGFTAACVGAQLHAAVTFMCACTCTGILALAHMRNTCLRAT